MVRIASWPISLPPGLPGRHATHRVVPDPTSRVREQEIQNRVRPQGQRIKNVRHGFRPMKRQHRLEPGLQPGTRPPHRHRRSGAISQVRQDVVHDRAAHRSLQDQVIRLPSSYRYLVLLRLKSKPVLTLSVEVRIFVRHGLDIQVPVRGRVVGNAPGNAPCVAQVDARGSHEDRADRVRIRRSQLRLVPLAGLPDRVVWVRRQYRASRRAPSGPHRPVVASLTRVVPSDPCRLVTRDDRLLSVLHGQEQIHQVRRQASSGGLRYRDRLQSSREHPPPPLPYGDRVGRCPRLRGVVQQVELHRKRVDSLLHPGVDPEREGVQDHRHLVRHLSSRCRASQAHGPMQPV